MASYDTLSSVDFTLSLWFPPPENVRIKLVVLDLRIVKMREEGGDWKDF